METAKKAYHMACKEEKLAAAREANGKTEASVTPDQQKKLHEKVDKCKQDVQKVGKRQEKLYCTSIDHPLWFCRSQKLFLELVIYERFVRKFVFPFEYLHTTSIISGCSLKSATSSWESL